MNLIKHFNRIKIIMMIKIIHMINHPTITISKINNNIKISNQINFYNHPNIRQFLIVKINLVNKVIKVLLKIINKNLHFTNNQLRINMPTICLIILIFKNNSNIRININIIIKMICI